MSRDQIVCSYLITLDPWTGVQFSSVVLTATIVCSGHHCHSSLCCYVYSPCGLYVCMFTIYVVFKYFLFSMYSVHIIFSLYRYKFPLKISCDTIFFSLCKYLFLFKSVIVKVVHISVICII